MVRARRIPASNVPGDLFVDESCIACDTCRRFAPQVFGGGEDDVAFVARQPRAAAERDRALLALVSCPVAAIGSRSKEGVRAAASALPREIAPGVLECGYAAESSFGAAAYLVRREQGNVLVDSPRFTRPLADRIGALGGVRWMFLTHRDDVADHARWRDAFRCDRVLHASDVSAETRDVEVMLEGEAPARIDEELVAVPVPGHTRGSAALSWRRFLFTGDHVWGNAAGQLEASRSVCWWDWGAQTRSMLRLADVDGFDWILPGHGRPWRAASPADARAALRALAESMAR